MNPFSDDVIEAVRQHMNGDHADDCLVICRALGGVADATAAEMTGMDGEGIDFAATVDGSSVPVRVAWSHPLTERGEVRVEVVRLYDESLAKLGLPPREPQQH